MITSDIVNTSACEERGEQQHIEFHTALMGVQFHMCDINN